MSEGGLLVGYGTLLHRGSLGRSIGHGSAESKGITPVVVPGFQRLFNLRPDHYESSFKLGSGPIEKGAMNVEEADGFSFNGLCFQVTRAELKTLDARERYYERRTVNVYGFEDDEPLGEAFVYAGKPDSPWIERDTRHLMPLWRDIVWARSGAYGISEEFGEFYDATTYLADGTTLMIDVYRDLLRAAGDGDEPHG